MTIPITVIGGYLGSGKTTLLNRALFAARPGALRDVAILVNDFGSVNIDEALIRSQTPDGKVLGLVGGCVCCAVQDDLGRALGEMHSIGVRHVVIEASGVASPAKIAGYGRDWPGFRARGSVVVINAVTLRDRLADRYVGSLVARQIKEASALVVHSNCEALDTVALAAGRACWHASDPDVLELLFDDRHDLVQQRHCTTAAIPQFATVTLRQQQAMDRGALDAWLGGLPAGIARVKGFVATPAETLLVQRVADHLEITPAPGCATPTLVLIAPREVFSPAALACLAPPGWTAAAR